MSNGEEGVLIQEFQCHLGGSEDFKTSCWFRILTSESRPFVVICSQHENQGRSICNAHEWFRSELARVLAKKRTQDDVMLARNNLATIEGFLKPSVVTLVDMLIKRWIKKDVYARLSEDCLWYEHWPSDRTMSKREEFWEVTLDGEGDPQFSEVSLGEIVKGTGYSEEELRLRFISKTFKASA